jgi:signal transduction histidine kinase
VAARLAMMRRGRRGQRGWLSLLSGWRQLSLRGQLTLVATALLTGAVITGAVLTVYVVRRSLTSALDSSAIKTGRDIAAVASPPPVIVANNSGVVAIQVVDADNAVLSHSPGADAAISIVSKTQLAEVRAGHPVSVRQADTTDGRIRVLGVDSGPRTVLVASDSERIGQSTRIVQDAALVGCPLAIVAMALLTYFIVGRTLRPVAALRHGAEDITAAGLSDQRLPVGDAQDEIRRLAVTLNAMLDRIDVSTSRQRTFVGDAAHELKSPLASLRVQLEVALRLGATTDWQEVVSDVLVDVERLDTLVADLLMLARIDEAGGALRTREPIELATLVEDVVAQYDSARVPVTYEPESTVIVEGDVDGLRRVVVNLVDNAQRFAHDSIVITLRADGPTAELSVADDGPGIPEAERERVFDRFYRTESSRSRESGGTGLGLPIVRDLVRAHGGTVKLTANDPGLRAVVTFPTRPTGSSARS